MMVVICPAGPFASLAVLSGWIPGQAGWMCFLAVLDILAGYTSYVKFECSLCWHDFLAMLAGYIT
jgi:hypothetical protein